MSSLPGVFAQSIKPGMPIIVKPVLGMLENKAYVNIYTVNIFTALF